jgi:hypothetical protein
MDQFAEAVGPVDAVEKLINPRECKRLWVVRAVGEAGDTAVDCSVYEGPRARSLT